MICKTEAVVLRTYKYQESHLIAVLFTQSYGIKHFLIKGFRSPRNRKKYSYFQPLSIVEIIFFEKAQRELQQIKESKTAHILYHIQTHPIKLSLGLSMIEIFYQCVKEETTNEPLYAFLVDCITHIDRSEDKLIQTFLFFLVHFTRFLGFFPNDISGEAPFAHLNVREGILEATPEKTDPVSILIREFMRGNLESSATISFDQSTKKALVKTLFNYYYIHIDGFSYPNTLKVFSEVFG